MKYRLSVALAVCLVAFLAWSLRSTPGQEPKPKRVPWTTSKITGTPEPPHPYKAERVFPKLSFNEPVFLVRAPGIDRWFVGERRGVISSFPKNHKVEKADLFLDLTKEIKSWDDASNIRRVSECYALVFHPEFAKNRYCYICYIVESKKPGEAHPEGSRISRFTVTDTDPPRIDPKSEQIVITFLAGGHNGCDLHFGNDGMLYISTGDAASPNPPDKLDTGQDISDLLSSILRIDVDHPAPGKNYSIPKDNPFVHMPKARGEVWSYGFRNPWRMSFDRPTGNLWVGDVGWELWEMIFKIEKGGNYGWSVKEGPQDIRPNAKHGPTPILPPTIAFPHTEAASITGGFVYHGKKFPELEGAYICGDWVSRKIWATKFDGDKKLWHKEIAQTNAKIVAFGEDADGELYVVDHANPAGLYTLVPNPAAKGWTDTFPRKLSETGLFASTKDDRLAPGVEPFRIAAGRWMDGAESSHFVALPGLSSAKMYDAPIRNDDEFWNASTVLPKDGVLGKTISMSIPNKEVDGARTTSARRLETQILHFDGKQWNPYTYVWNEDQTDASLAPASGTDIVLDRRNASGNRESFKWHVASRSECSTCHNPWAGFTLAFTPPQIQVIVAPYNFYPQVDFLKARGFVEFLQRDGRNDTPLRRPLPKGLVSHEPRTYLHVNCAHCHQFGAGGSADIDLRYTTPANKMKVFDVRPTQGDFGIADAKIVSPGRPYQSTLFYRMAKSGRGHMPHLGAHAPDPFGLSLIYRWIHSTHVDTNVSEAIDRLREIVDFEFGETAKLAPERRKLVSKLLESPAAALELLHFTLEHRRESVLDQDLAALVPDIRDPFVRDLFDRYVPEEKRALRLGTQIDPNRLLSSPGEIANGRALFFSSIFQCGQCHRVGKEGGNVGPDLSDVAKRLSKTQIIESLLAPSKTIEPKYLTHQVETNAGVVHTGLLVEKSAKEIVLRVVGDKEVRVPVGEVVAETTLKTSLMPEHLLRDATAAQAGDLLAYLWSLK